MHARVVAGLLGRIGLMNVHRSAEPPASDGLAWRRLPPVARLYVTAVIAAGTSGLIEFFPRTYPQPMLFGALVLAACLTSMWKVNLPIALSSSSTLSVSYAASLMSLLLLGPKHALIVGVAGAWTQCTYKIKEPYPLYRTVFSTAAEAITMVATGLIYAWLGGEVMPFHSSALAKPLVGAIATYFVVNTGLVAGAIAFSTRQNFLKVWHDDFLWSGASFMVAGSAGAMAAVVVARGEFWKAMLMLPPVYLTYRTYELFVGRLDDHKRHMAEMRSQHNETVEALAQARTAERALAEEKERLAVTLADMTRLEDGRNQLLEREQAARASAEQANRLKDQFLAIVSHELRTPLNAILGWSDMLRRGRLEEVVRDRAFRAINESAKRQAQLIDDLLDVARIMSGKLRLERGLVDLEEVVRGAVQVVQPLADAKQIRIAIVTDPSIGQVYGDAARLQQIAWNLLSNAVKFTPEDGVVHIHLCRVRGTVEMIVTDTGQGIGPDFLPWVFEAFRQADGSSTRLHGGLGLGLSIVRHLVEAHKGTVSAESDGEGRGARFIVRLPMAVVYASTSISMSADRSAAATEDLDPPQSLEGTSVLVVDDDEQCRAVVAAHLQCHHAAVLTASSAAEAFDLLQREHVDVLLADIAMPGEDGYSLIRKVRSARALATASIPAASLTAFARDEDRRHSLEAGFQLHLVKPIDSRSLVAAVATLKSRAM